VVLTALLTRTDAYYGKNTKIADTLNNLLLKSPQNWQTSIGLPFFRIESTVCSLSIQTPQQNPLCLSVDAFVSFLVGRSSNGT
jgi:hypothetical protein